MTSLESIDLQHVIGGNSASDAGCQRVADTQYANDLSRLAQPGMPGSPAQLARARSLAWTDSRGNMERCQSGANAQVAAGVQASSLDFDKLAAPR